MDKKPHRNGHKINGISRRRDTAPWGWYATRLDYKVTNKKRTVLSNATVFDVLKHTTTKLDIYVDFSLKDYNI